jgi:hypothetical protein
MMPRLGMIVPAYEMPPVRYCLYPSMCSTAYTEEEMLRWYTPHDLDEDDRLMLKAEELGQKLKAYLEWLANTAARVAQGRLDMLQEDKRSAICKTYWDSLETKLNVHAEGSVLAASRLGFQDALPTAFDYIQEETVKYEFGSGADNEDELHDLVAEMERQKEGSLVTIQKLLACTTNLYFYYYYGCCCYCCWCMIFTERTVLYCAAIPIIQL